MTKPLPSWDILKIRFNLDRVGDVQMFSKPPRHHPENGRFEDKEYLAWIRTFPCTSCGALSGVEAHHHWKTRWNDYTAIPMCVKCHEFGIHASQSHTDWEASHNVCLSEEITRYNMLYIAILKGIL